MNKKISILILTVVGISSFSIINLLNKKSSFIPRNTRTTEQSNGWKGASEWLSKVRSDFNTGELNIKDVMLAQKQVKTKGLARNASLVWTELGPDDIGGRTRAILVDKTEPTGRRIYAGGVSGGLFVSTDQAGSWSPLKDNIENMCVSSIAQAPDGTIYFGTGSAFDLRVGGGTGNSAFIGQGLFKLTPGTSNIEKISGASTSGFNNEYEEWTEVNDIEINQKTGRIWVANRSGIKYSDDKGSTWTNPIPGFASSRGQDIELLSNGYVIVSLGGRLFHSEDGENFTNLTSQLNLSTSTAQRLAIKSAKSDVNYVYALAVQNELFYGLYRSTDAGKNWKLIQAPIAGYFQPMDVGAGGQGYYDTMLGVDPQDKNNVFIGGVQIWRWNGNLTQIGCEFCFKYSGNYVHSDKHTITWDPFNPNIVYVGTDGGISKSMDNGNTFFPSNKGYNVTQFYEMAFDSDGKVMGGTQDNGTLEITGKGITGKESEEVSGGDGFSCAYSQYTDAKFSTIYYGQVLRSQQGGSVASICGDPDGQTSTTKDDEWKCQDDNFYTKIELWESVNDLTSQDSVTFKVEDGINGFAIATGNSTKKSFTGKFTPSQKSAKIVTNSIRVEADNMILTDSGNGNLTGDGTGSFDYVTGEYTINLNTAPKQNSLVRIFLKERYDAGDEIELFSNIDNVKVRGKEFKIKHTLTTDLNPSETVKVQDPVQSLLAFGATGGRIWITRGGTNFKANPDWFLIPLNTSGSVNAMKFTKDGNHLFVALDGSVYRISGLNNVYTETDASTKVTRTRIFSSSRTFTDISIDADNPENVVVTAGNYGQSDYIFKSNAALSTTNQNSFTPIQGDLPKMPIYSVLINSGVSDKRIIVGTEYGVYSTSFGNPSTWTDENGSLAHVPVFSVIQQQLDWKSADNHEVIYAGTHGRGIWKTTTLTSVADAEKTKKDATISTLKVYPNPTDKNSVIEFNSTTNELATISIYNLQGKLVEQRKVGVSVGNNKIALTEKELTTGVYFVNIQTSKLNSSNRFLVK